MSSRLIKRAVRPVETVRDTHTNEVVLHEYANGDRYEFQRTRYAGGLTVVSVRTRGRFPAGIPAGHTYAWSEMPSRDLVHMLQNDKPEYAS